MMKYLSRWRKKASFESLLWLESQEFHGVKFALRKTSLAQRIKLASRVRELNSRNEFLRAGDLSDQLDAAMADLLVARLYLEWALVEVRGIRIDGKAASTELLIERGPEALVHEVAAAIRSQLELSDTDRKNF